MEDKQTLGDVLVHHLNGFTGTLSTIVSDGTDFGNFPDCLTPELIDFAEEKLGLAASYMRTIKNSSRLACKLPRGVLDTVFVHTMSHFRDFRPFPIRHDCGGRWHPSILSGVCRYWRAVALSCPTIWSTIYLGDGLPCASLTFAQLSLRRSYGVNLNVYIDYQREIPQDAMHWLTEDLAAQSLRFVGFHLHEHGQQHSASLIGVLSECPALELRYLTLQPDTLPADSTVDPLLFTGFLPNIKRITTSQYKLWPTYRLTTLTHVCATETVFSLAEVLDLLSCNPCLEVLVLQTNDTTFLDEDHCNPPTVGISLPHLHKVHLTDYATTFCARILNAIRPPPNLDLMIDYVRPAPSHSLLTTISRLSLVSTVSTIVLCSSSYPARLRVLGVGLGSFDVLPGADVHEAGSNQYMAGLLALLSACPVKEMRIEGDQVVTRVPLWQRIFLATPLVNKLVLTPSHPAHELAGSAYLSALCAVDETLGLVLPCPLLKEIVLRGPFTGQRSDHGKLYSAWLTKDFRQFLVDRRTRGFPLRKLTLVLRSGDSPRYAGDLTELKGLVEEFNCVDESRLSDVRSPIGE